MIFLLIMTTLCTSTLAAGGIPYQEYNSHLLQQLAARGQTDIDSRLPLPRPQRRRRQDDEASDSSATAESEPEPTAESADDSRNDDDEASPTSDDDAEDEGDIETAPNEPGTTSTSLPSPFDTSLGNNFSTSSCPEFFDEFLNDPTFQECHPTALLLQNSNSFFRAVRDEKRLSASLDASCGASLAQCSPLMASLASELVMDSNCGEEYQDGNPIVTHAQAGLVAYEPVYRAACLTNEETEDYCFIDAVNNSSNQEDFFIYHLAIGTELPAASRPTCNQCLVDVMDVYAGYATNDEQPVSETYTSAAKQVNLACGPDFVNASLPVRSASASPIVHQALFTANFGWLFIALLVCLTAL